MQPGKIAVTLLKPELEVFVPFFVIDTNSFTDKFEAGKYYLKFHAIIPADRFRQFTRDNRSYCK